MNILLWVIQILLALLFLIAGGTKLAFPIEKLMAQGPPNQIHFPGLFLRFIGVCEVLGALGLILPGLLRIGRRLTFLAALGLLILMISAVAVSIAGPGVSTAIVPTITAVLCAFVAYGRRPTVTRNVR